MVLIPSDYQSTLHEIKQLVVRARHQALLELANKPMGVATYSYNTLPKDIAEYLPNEELLKKLVIDS